MFCIHTFTKTDGINKEFNYIAGKTFERGISLTKDPNVLTAWITENRWCPEQNSMIVKDYHIFNESIYEKSDMIMPVFSINSKYESYMKNRNELYSICSRVASFFDEVNIQHNIKLEYFYGFTIKDIDEFMSKIFPEFSFYNSIVTNGTELKSLVDALNLFNVKIPNLRGLLENTPKDIITVVINALSVEFKKWLIPNVYGGDKQLFTSLRLT